MKWRLYSRALRRWGTLRAGREQLTLLNGAICIRDRLVKMTHLLGREHDRSIAQANATDNPEARSA
jgi:hypothetical protein